VSKVCVCTSKSLSTHVGAGGLFLHSVSAQAQRQSWPNRWPVPGSVKGSALLALPPGLCPGLPLPVPNSFPNAQADLSVNVTLRDPVRKLRSTAHVSDDPSNGGSFVAVWPVASPGKKARVAVAARRSTRMDDMVPIRFG